MNTSVRLVGRKLNVKGATVMAKVEMNGFTVNNVEPCPKCKATQYARRNTIMKIVEICCDKCDYTAPGGIMINGSYSLKADRKAFIGVTRDMFNFWNKAIAKELNIKEKKVRITSSAEVSSS